VQPEPEQILSSTAVKIEQRTVPRPQTKPEPPQPAERAAASQPPRPKALPKLASRPLEPGGQVELARQTPNASPQPSTPATVGPGTAKRPSLPSTPSKASQPTKPSQSTTATTNISRDQQKFDREVAQLEKKPLSLATTEPQPPWTRRRTPMDMSGPKERPDHAVVFLIGTSHWKANGLSCYYAHFVAQLDSGSTEEGDIPWPVCYPPGQDYMSSEKLIPAPVPYPPADYVLPSGTYVTPIVKSWYEKVHGGSP
jgi:hypothetical protein